MSLCVENGPESSVVYTLNACTCKTWYAIDFYMVTWDIITSKAYTCRIYM